MLKPVMNMVKKLEDIWHKWKNLAPFLVYKLSHLIFSGIEQLSLTLQGKDTTIQEAIIAAELAIGHLQWQRKDDVFNTFYSHTVESAKELTAPPTLPRYRQPPKRLDDSFSSGHRFSTLESYFRKQKNFEVLDLLISELQRQFQQKRGMPVVAAIERVIMNAANGTVDDLPQDLKLYEKDVNLPRLKIQLQMLPNLIRTRNQKLTSSPPIKKVTNLRTM